jgi:hypothetical protein
VNRIGDARHCQPTHPPSTSAQPGRDLSRRPSSAIRRWHSLRAAANPSGVTRPPFR